MFGENNKTIFIGILISFSVEILLKTFQELNEMHRKSLESLLPELENITLILTEYCDKFRILNLVAVELIESGACDLHLAEVHIDKNLEDTAGSESSLAHRHLKLLFLVKIQQILNISRLRQQSH